MNWQGLFHNKRQPNITCTLYKLTKLNYMLLELAIFIVNKLKCRSGYKTVNWY